MYNINYRDERTERPELNFKTWQSLNAQHQPQLRPSLPSQQALQQQQQQPLQQQQSLQQQQPVQKQPILQQVIHQQIISELQSQQQHGLRQATVQQQQQPSVPVRERLWVEISDDEDSNLCPPSVFKSDVKSQPTPPLDLTTMERTKLGSRHVESPLDLSVKTRKRHADTTDYVEYAQGRGHVGDVSMAKRMYLASHNMSPQQGLSKERYMANLIQSEQKQFNMSESLMKAKYSLKPSATKNLARRVSPQSNQLATTQQQYASIQRQHQIQQLQQTQHQQHQVPQQQQQHQQRVRQMPVSPGQLFQGTQDNLRSSSHQLHRQHSPYPSLSACQPAAAAAPSPQSNSSETVALQGFFEPTQSLTVNPGQSRSNYKPGMATARSDQSVYAAAHSPMMHPNINRSREIVSNMEDIRRQMVSTPQFSNAPSKAAPSIVRKDIGMRPSGNVTNISQLEMLQQQQLQRQKHLQVQREQAVVLSGVPQPVSTHGSIGRVIHQDRASGAHVYDIQKRQEPGMIPSKVPYPSPKEQISPYSQKLQHKYMSSHSSHSAINQGERTMYSAAHYASVSQPVSLSDLPKQSAIADKTRLSQSRTGNFGQMISKPESSVLNYFQSKQQSLINESTISDSRQRARQLEILEREQRYRHGIPESIERPYQDRMDHGSTLRRDIHPSVIQKPQGFIPPRIVSGSGRAASATLNSENNKSVPDTVLRRYSMDTRPVDSRDQASIEHLYRRNSSDSSQRGMSRDSKHGSAHIRDETSVNRSSSSRQQGPSINTNKRDLTPTSQHHQQSKLHFSHRGMSASAHDTYQRSSAGEVHSDRTAETFNIDQAKLDKPGVREAKGSELNKQSNAVIMSALSGVMIPQLSQKPSERSITKGTSGLKTDIPAVEFFGHIINREFKKTEEASRVNPFANRSILQEYDRSRNTPTPSKTEQNIGDMDYKQKPVDQNVKDEVEMSTSSLNASYDHPLQIAIPLNKSSSTPSEQTPESGNTSFSTITKQQDNRSKSPTKVLSRKQMILMAFKQEEDQKNTVNIDNDQKIPMESHKFASSKRSERDTNSQSNFPPSPKMPILSPQERNRTSTAVSSGTSDPPNLEATPVSSANLSNPMCSNQSKSNSDINSFEEHLHKLISDAVKGSVNKDKDAVYETVCRELTTQPPGKVFITRQLSQNKNIPVANVAPIVHGRNMNDSGNERQESKIKMNVELDEEDEKLAAVVTRSLFESSFGFMDEKSGKQDSLKDKDKGEIKLEQETTITVAHSVVETNFKSKIDDSIFDEDSNSTKRMSPGLKKLMLYRHRDLADNSRDCATPATDSDQSLSQMSDAKVSVPDTVTRSKDGHKEGECERNVFGTFNEILAQKCGGKVDKDYSTASWSEVKMEDEELDIQMVPNTDYDGDDEDMKDQKKLPSRRSRKSSVKQQADRLIKKARDRRKSEGKSPTRKCRGTKRDSSPLKQQPLEVKNEQQTKLRQRRSSSLDRDTKKKHNTNKSKQICYSDNEIDIVVSQGAVDVAGETWRDESTDEDYFQNYQEELKQTGSLCEEDTEPACVLPAVKKVNTNKRRKGFHFKQKYIFQRKRKPKNKAKRVDQVLNVAGSVETSFNFQEEVQSYSPIPFGSAEIGFYDNIPIPPEVKKLSVNKDTGETLLHRAARMGHEEVALYCLATGSVDVNARDNAGYTALHECCVRGQQEIGRILLKHGADVNCCSVDGIRPIHDAVEIDQIEMVRLLLSFGADPTLSTYAGRSLLKIARSERMKKFLHDYHSDLNGYETDSAEKPWTFVASTTLLESKENRGCPIFAELPSDPEEEIDDLCTLSAKPLFVNRRLAPEHGKRVEDYVLLQDILNSYKVTKRDFESIGISPHLIKRLSVHNLQDSLTDSIFIETFTQNEEDQATVPALRAVDTSQLVAKLEKFVQSASKRSKS